MEGDGAPAVGQQQLPVDAWLHVFAFLAPLDLLAVGAVWRALCEAMQPSSLYARYAAHLQAAADDNEDKESSGSSFKRAFMARCMRDQLWEGKHFTVQKVHIKAKWSISVRGVAVSPKNKELVSVAAYDENARILKNREEYQTTCLPNPTASYSFQLNSTCWTCDGDKVAYGSHSKSLFVLDAATMSLHCSYINRFFGDTDRAPLAAHPDDPNLLFGAGSNNATLTVFDLRVAEPIKEWNPHQSTVRDMCFVEGAQFGINSKWALASIGQSGLARKSTVHISDVAAGTVRATYVSQESSKHEYYRGAYSLAMPPPYFGLTARSKRDYDLNRFVVAGGVGFAESFKAGQRKECIRAPDVSQHFWRMRYNSNGTLLFLVTDDGTLELFRRHPDGTHSHLYRIFEHENDVEDCDIAPDDSYVVTASQDGTVGYVMLHE